MRPSTGPDGVVLAVDAMGGDHGPAEVVPGSIDHARAHPEDVVLLVGDPDQIRQVVLNLLANGAHAMRATGASGTVRLWADGARVHVEVLDGGPGIPPDVMARIFEPFFTTKPAGEGTGLGLSISHGIIRAHGGDIRAENRPGGGARFWFELPRHPGRGAR